MKHQFYCPLCQDAVYIGVGDVKLFEVVRSVTLSADIVCMCPECAHQVWDGVMYGDTRVSLSDEEIRDYCLTRMSELSVLGIEPAKQNDRQIWWDIPPNE